jgi:peroxiredoxin Q/BCP
MVSLDDAQKNREFASSVGAGFVLLSDPDQSNAERYGVLALGGLYARRWTFFIDANGIVRRIDKNVRPETAGEDVVRALADLGFPKRSSETPRPGP